jgi:hypothetical protein
MSAKILEIIDPIDNTKSESWMLFLYYPKKQVGSTPHYYENIIHTVPYHADEQSTPVLRVNDYSA